MSNARNLANLLTPATTGTIPTDLTMTGTTQTLTIGDAGAERGDRPCSSRHRHEFVFSPWFCDLGGNGLARCFCRCIPLDGIDWSQFKYSFY